MIKINDVRYEIEMTNFKFRIGVIWSALFHKYLEFISRETTLDDNYCDDVSKKLKINKKK